MTQAIIFRFAAVAMAVGVACGAFGAHALKERLTPGDLAIWQTAVLYQLVHAVALIGVAAMWPLMSGARADWGVRLVMVGMVIFSLTLYLLVLTGPRWLGAITPIGGSAMILGWLLFATASIQSIRSF